MSDNGQVSIRVLFFGAARDVVDSNPLELSLDAPATVSTAFKSLVERFSQLERFGRSLLFAVNQEYATPDTLLHENDELAVFPPVSGGSSCDYRCPLDFFELTTEPIDVGQVARRVVLPECGATVTLDGYAREWTKGKRTLYLVYEAYDGMALTEMERLGAEAHKRFEIAHLGIVHRTGRLEIGETSVVIAASAPHRKAAFEACEWAIKELKRTVPIWKKEVYADGEEEWVGTTDHHG
ncbi:MAG TPA: molybdenum cofactor biosynthesis protein MoaE [Pyrinomonadaceae bacterium]|nr:molybdenum cofactor biosynthesis protein MoaE [Pyrinomonadaceae bacterium]